MTEPIIVDIRSRLPRVRINPPKAQWEIGWRDVTHFVTLHYNGDPVRPANQSGSGLISQLVSDTNWQMRPGGLNAKDGGDGLQYHYVIGAEPQVYQCRDENALLWHCGNGVGNAESISIHVPVGQTLLSAQTITDEHWELIVQLVEWLLDKYRLPYTAFKDHKEWNGSQCPGRHLHPRLLSWRAAKASAPNTLQQPSFVYYTVTKNLALVHTAPDAASPVVLTMREGTTNATTGIDAIVPGEYAGAGKNRSNQWLHRADGRGFIHSSAMKRI